MNQKKIVLLLAMIAGCFLIPSMTPKAEEYISVCASGCTATTLQEAFERVKASQNTEIKIQLGEGTYDSPTLDFDGMNLSKLTIAGVKGDKTVIRMNADDYIRFTSQDETASAQFNLQNLVFQIELVQEDSVSTHSWTAHSFINLENAKATISSVSISNVAWEYVVTASNGSLNLVDFNVTNAKHGIETMQTEVAFDNINLKGLTNNGIEIQEAGDRNNHLSNITIVGSGNQGDDFLDNDDANIGMYFDQGITDMNNISISNMTGGIVIDKGKAKETWNKITMNNVGYGLYIILPERSEGLIIDNSSFENSKVLVENNANLSPTEAHDVIFKNSKLSYIEINRQEEATNPMIVNALENNTWTKEPMPEENAITHNEKDKILYYTTERQVVTISKAASKALTDIFKDDRAGDISLTWTSGDPNIAYVENGKLIAKAEGSTTLEAKLGDIKTFTIDVDVIQNPHTNASLYLVVGLSVLGLVATATYYVYNEMNKKKRS